MMMSRVVLQGVFTLNGSRKKPGIRCGVGVGMVGKDGILILEGMNYRDNGSGETWVVGNPQVFHHHS